MRVTSIWRTYRQACNNDTSGRFVFALGGGYFRAHWLERSRRHLWPYRIDEVTCARLVGINKHGDVASTVVVWVHRLVELEWATWIGGHRDTHLGTRPRIPASAQLYSKHRKPCVSLVTREVR